MTSQRPRPRATTWDAGAPRGRARAPRQSLQPGTLRPGRALVEDLELRVQIAPERGVVLDGHSVVQLRLDREPRAESQRDGVAHDQQANRVAARRRLARARRARARTARGRCSATRGPRDPSARGRAPRRRAAPGGNGQAEAHHAGQATSRLAPTRSLHARRPPSSPHPASPARRRAAFRSPGRCARPALGPRPTPPSRPVRAALESLLTAVAARAGPARPTHWAARMLATTPPGGPRPPARTTRACPPSGGSGPCGRSRTSFQTQAPACDRRQPAQGGRHEGGGVDGVMALLERRARPGWWRSTTVVTCHTAARGAPPRTAPACPWAGAPRRRRPACSAP